jgi:hypothetical protein
MPTDDLHVYTDGYDYVVASDSAQAEALYCEYYGDECYREFRRMGDLEELSIRVEDDGSIAQVGDSDCEPLTLTAAEWVTREGKGWLCTTEG